MNYIPTSTAQSEVMIISAQCEGKEEQGVRAGSGGMMSYMIIGKDLNLQMDTDT